MLSKLSRFLTIATITTLTCVITHPANADNHDADMVKPNTEIEFKVGETFNEAFWYDEYNVEETFTRAFNREGGFFENTRPGRFLNDTMFGLRRWFLGSYPENEIARDGLLVYAIMNDYFKQLKEDHPTLRTRDISNPFDLSLRDDLDTFVEDDPVPVYETQYQFDEPVPPSEPVRGLY